MMKPFLIGLSVAALSACANITAPEDAARTARASLPDAPSAWAMASERVGPVEAGWLAKLDDPVLTALVDEALVNNRNLQAAAANVQRSWALAGQAGAALSPSVSLSSGTTRSGNIEDTGADSYSLTGQASWEVDLWGRIRAGNQAAVLSAEAAEADYVYSQYSLAAAVARAYFLAIEADRQAETVQNTLDALNETDRIVGVQFEFGLATSQDVALSRSDLARTKASLIAARGSQRDALRALEVLLGRYPAADLDVRRDLPTVPALPPSGVPSEVLERRPDVDGRRAACCGRVQQSWIKQRRRKMPSISLTGSLGGSSGDLTNLINPTNVAWQAATSLVAPLIDGGLRESQVEQASAEQTQAIASYADTVLTAFQEVEGSLDQNVVLQERSVQLEQSAEQANNALRIANLRYEEGETDLLDVLTIQQRVLSSEGDVVSVERARLDEWIALNLALGGSWE